MITYNGKNGTTFIYNGDLSSLYLLVKDESDNNIRVCINGEDFRNFAKLIVGNEMISAIEKFL